MGRGCMWGRGEGSGNSMQEARGRRDPVGWRSVSEGESGWGGGCREPRIFTFPKAMSPVVRFAFGGRVEDGLNCRGADLETPIRGQGRDLRSA